MKLLVRIIFVLVLLVVANHLVHAQWQGMEVKQTIEIGYRPSSINIAKANDDEWRDIVLTPSTFGDFLHVLPGNSAGEFGAPQSTERENNYTQTDVGDFNKDGIDDLAISSYWSNRFRVYHGQANGTFSPAEYYGLTGHGKRVHVIDLNNDGALDLAALSGGSGQPVTLHIFNGDNSGQFKPNGVFSSVVHTDRLLRFIDKNEDGRIDIMVATSFPWFVIYYQTEHGTFEPQYWPDLDNVPLPYPHYDIGDFNHDGQPDVLASYFTFDNTDPELGLRIYPGNGGTSFSNDFIQLSYEGITASTVKLGDLNGDGYLDLVMNKIEDVIAFTYSDTLFYRLGNGDFTFGSPVPVVFPAPVVDWVIDDANNDGFPDFLAYLEDARLSIALNRNVVTGGEETVRHVAYAFPNPFEDELRIAATTYPAHVSIYQLSGAEVQSGIIEREIMVDASGWTSGLYLVRVNSASDNTVTKVLRQ